MKNSKIIFKEELSFNLKEECNIELCYTSRIIHDLCSPSKKGKKKLEISPPLKPINVMKSISENKVPEILKNKFQKHLAQNLLDLNNNNNSNQSFIYLDEINITKFSDDFSFDKQINYFIRSFEKIKKNTIIYNPKHYFFKIVFSNIFKNKVFYDKVFKAIKLTYLISNRKYNINEESKQMNYPTKQKNFSNSIEPRIFLKRDYNFYDKEFFPISHKYIKSEIVEKNEENIYFYPHEYKVNDIEQLNDKNINCELVTRQHIYFGKIYFTYDYIFFETEKDDPRNVNLNDIDLEVYCKYAISNKCPDNKEEIKKTVLIFCTDIKEIVQRRTLLVYESIEIFNKDGKSYFFNFFSTDEVKKVYIYIDKINNKLYEKNSTKFVFNQNNNKEEIKNILEKFHKGKLTNYDYLLYLNKYSARTYNDLSQYPVFPWLLINLNEINKVFDEILNNHNEISELRDLNYPITAQTVEKRKEIIKKFLEEAKEEKNPAHFGNTYSNSAYIFYYLMRINPYTQNLIKLQSYKMEEPDRTFNSINDIVIVLSDQFDNRELIPDIFCYIDYYINLNCDYYGIKKKKQIVDDFKIDNSISTEYTNIISNHINVLYNEKKLLNSRYISERISNWVDLIFGKKQYPKGEETILKCCNIYKKYSYEQFINMEEKINKYKELFKQYKYDRTKLIKKIKNKKEIISFFGVVPRQILKESNLYRGESKSKEVVFKHYKSSEDKYIYCIKLNEDNFLFLKKDNKKNSKSKIALIYEDKNFKSNNIYDCKYINSLKNKNYLINNKKKISLYKINYAITFLKIEYNNKIYPFILSCRYFGNYFKIQNNEHIFNIFCQDFVTCIKERSYCENRNNTFYTGLLNGKLTEWKILSYLDGKQIILNFDVKEIKNIYAHNSSITAIEIYRKQNVIITAGEDKFIQIRKVFDFELLTIIDLTYSFGNPIISKTLNIFPSSIKISDLNLLYVIIYDYDSKTNFVRGYNLNGHFFAQTNPKNLKKESNQCLLFNNISFTKNGNIIAWFYNWKKIMVLNAWNLMPVWNKNMQSEQKDNIENNDIIKCIEYNNISREFYILYDNEFIVETLKEKEEQIKFDSF